MRAPRSDLPPADGPAEDPSRPGAPLAEQPAELLYLHGPARIDEEVLAYAGIPHQRLDVGPIRGRAPRQAGINLLRLSRAVAQASGAMRKFQADVILATGGYVSAPAILAGALRRVPVVLYLPDTTPGLVIRAFTPLARRIALSFPVTKRYFPGSKAIVTGYPVRPEFLHAKRELGRKVFELRDDLPVVMIMGGSTGAHSLNMAVSQTLEPLLRHAQLMHLCGESDEQRLRRDRATIEPGLRIRYHLFRYLHRGIADAMAASDVIVCRSGASVLAELPVLGLPAILVPYPVPAVHQELNADYLVEQGAAVKMLDQDLGDGALLRAVVSLLQDHPRRTAMAQAMRRLARPEAAHNIASLVRAVARRRDKGESN